MNGRTHTHTHTPADMTWMDSLFGEREGKKNQPHVFATEIGRFLTPQCGLKSAKDLAREDELAYKKYSTACTFFRSLDRISVCDSSRLQLTHAS